MKAVVAAFNQEKALVGAFSEITNLWMELFEALELDTGERSITALHWLLLLISPLIIFMASVLAFANILICI